MSASSPSSPSRSAATTLILRDVSVSRGARVVLDRVDLTAAGGHRYGVVGPNGVGKSTLLAAAASAIPLDAGEVRTTPPDATVGWLHQEPERVDDTVRTALARRTGVTGAQEALDAATAALADGAPGAAEGEAPKACKIEFDLRYAFSSRPLELVVSPVFDRIANTFVDAFVVRAEQVYGAR